MAEQAAKAPQAVALEQDGQQLRYGEFEAQANRLAHHLRTLGVGPEVRVVLCVERSFDMVVGLVAILKAGGAFVPLDPSSPPDRLSLLLAEAEAPVLLTHADVRLSAPGVTVVRLDADAAQWASQPITPPESGVTLENANYVVFTSGSTGKPKPVINEHRGLAARVAFQRQHIPVHPGDRILFSAAIAFDGAIVDWMLSLCNGAACVLPSNAYDAVEGIAECLEHRAITFSFIPPAMLRALRCPAPALRHITLAGDSTPPSSSRSGPRVARSSTPTAPPSSASSPLRPGSIRRARSGSRSAGPSMACTSTCSTPPSGPSPRHARRDPPRRRRPRAWLFESPRDDRRALRAGSVREAAGRPHVLHRRPRALERGR
ncbi:AMP-binding protein [Nannocystis pusilla]|uniref:AMP-binding protein n=1 Tax=Nannocystis pusilla TaxID=889268 RepID=UPI003B828895